MQAVVEHDHYNIPLNIPTSIRKLIIVYRFVDIFAQCTVYIEYTPTVL